MLVLVEVLAVVLVIGADRRGPLVTSRSWRGFWRALFVKFGSCISISPALTPYNVVAPPTPPAPSTMDVSDITVISNPSNVEQLTDAQVRHLWAEEVMRRVSAWQYARDEALASRARR